MDVTVALINAYIRLDILCSPPRPAVSHPLMEEDVLREFIVSDLRVKSKYTLDELSYIITDISQ
jgi:hypothetical protein